MSARKVIYEKLLNAQFADETAAAVLLAAQTQFHTVSVVWSPGTSAGNIVVESAPYKEYTGRWAPIAEVPWSVANAVDDVRFQGAFGAVRTRIETAIVGGTADTYIAAN